MAITDNLPFGYHEHIQRGIDSLVEGVRALMQGDIGGLLAGVFGALPVFGAFLVMYGLIYFTGVISIFKAQEHKRYASYLAWGVALMGLMNGDVMGFLINFLGGSLILILLLILVVSFIVGKWVNARKGHFENAQGRDQAKARALEAKRDRREQAQEVFMQKKLHKNEEGALKQIKGKVNFAMKIQQDALSTIRHMISVLTKIASITDTKEKEKLQIHFVKRMDGFNSQIKEEYLDLEKVRIQMNKLEEFEIKGVRVHEQEATTTARVNNHFKKVINSIIEPDLGKEEKKKRAAEEWDKVAATAKELSGKLIILDKRRIQLEESIKKYLTHVENEIRGDVLGLKQQLTTALHSGDIPTSLNILHKLEYDLRNIEQETGNVNKQIQEIERFEQEKLNLETEFNNLAEFITSKKVDRELSKGKYNKLDKEIKNEEKELNKDSKQATQDIKQEKKDSKKLDEN